MEGFTYYPKWTMMDIKPNDIAWNAPVSRWDARHQRKVIGRPAQGYGVEPFAYAGKTIVPLAWPASPKVNTLRKRLETFLGVEFYFCLAGLYEDNTVGIPMHHDEIERDDDIIVSLSFGPSRLFQVKGPGNVIENYVLEHGDMVIMTGASQRLTQHSVPPLANRQGPRVNLTYRTKG